MTWVSSKFSSPTDWILSGTGMGVDPAYPNTDDLVSLYYTDNSKTFNTGNGYQYVTEVGEMDISSTFSISTTWNDRFAYINSINGLTATPPPGAYVGNSTLGYLYYHSTPSAKIISNTYSTFIANKKFGDFGSTPGKIYSLDVNEINWMVQGFAYFKTSKEYSPNLPDITKDTLGWTYYKDVNSYVWVNNNQSSYYPVGGDNGTKSANKDYTTNNNLSNLVNFEHFNLHFSYEKLFGGDNDGIDIYLSTSLPPTTGNLPFWFFSSPATIVSSITQSGPLSGSFYGLKGNQYIYIVARDSGSVSPTYSMIKIGDIRIEGGYHDGNNQQYLMTNSGSYSSPTTLEPIGLTGATYSISAGTGNTINGTQSLTYTEVLSKVGNGVFKSGVWENGIWNNGWRKDESVYEFYKIDQYYDYEKGKNWRILISGPESSVSKFKVGDKVAIGNIVAIDINEDRRLIKSSFTILGTASSTSIVVEFTNNFPLRRIEKDSDKHRILITKNVWLSGVFFNGYFKGIWNSGLFRGYPLISEMYETHWIDGIFDGGHFSSEKWTTSFSDTIISSNAKLGLTFSNPHRLMVGDTIIIDKDDKTFNSQYDKSTTVTEVVNEYQVITDTDWGYKSATESGTIYTEISNGLIQNFDFHSNNVSESTSVMSLDSEVVFNYNSWIDVNYDETSAINIGKQHTLINNVSRKSYSQNNLYGYPTSDVLSSTSKFRDSYSLTERDYKLGSKYKIFSDYIGDSSTFDEYFGPTGSDSILFIDQGWTFSQVSTSSITFSRTNDSGVDPIIGKELKVESIGSGGILDISQPSYTIRDRNTNDIEKNRYTIVEFDILTYSVNNDYYSTHQAPKTSIWFGGGTKYKGPDAVDPIIHFNNVNSVVRDVAYWGVGTVPVILPATYLPVYQNIDHLRTPGTKKHEFFYGKRNLAMHFKGSGLYGASQSSFVIDNLKLYEIDMVPFFQYFQEGNINRSVQIPYIGIAPVIDYTNSNFSFLDNISIGFDSIKIVK